MALETASAEGDRLLRQNDLNANDNLCRSAALLTLLVLTVAFVCARPGLFFDQHRLALMRLESAGGRIANLASGYEAHFKLLQLPLKQGVNELARLDGPVRALDLSGTDTRDLAPLSRLVALETLNLQHTRVSDLRPLIALQALRSLKLRGTGVSDITALAHLPRLHTLDLGFTRVDDVTPLAKLAALRSLDLHNTPITDLRPLAALGDLQTLDLGYTFITDATPLAELDTLLSLNLSGTAIADLSPLQNLSRLWQLNLINAPADNRAQRRLLRRALPRLSIVAGE